MQFIYHKDASKENITISDKLYKYLFKVKRVKLEDKIEVRNLIDLNLYEYKIEHIEKKTANLKLINTVNTTPTKEKRLHIVWCVIDNKIIEKTLPALNQIGVDKITFVYCERSQNNFKLNFERMKEILINSSQQCGRFNIIELEEIKSLDEVLKKYQNISILDFGGERVWSDIYCVLIGCEGGFSTQERERLKHYRKISFNSNFILKSETAAISFSSKLLI